MEAATVQTKKAISKGKLKKTIKNVLCRPDPVFWPLISNDHTVLLKQAINKYKIDIPCAVKLHWKDLKVIPKEKRPKPQKTERVNGLLFGMSECYNALKSKKCAAIIIEASINPRIIVQHVIEACIELERPVICLNDLRTTSSKNFNITTSCLGINSDLLPELFSLVSEIANYYPVQRREVSTSSKVELMETMSSAEPIKTTDSEVTLAYLYRTDKKSRVFVPSELEENRTNNMQKFNGQDFIAVTEKVNTKVDKKSYMKMVVKRISNNPNRLQSKKRKA